jgi:hypothetical protein
MGSVRAMPARNALNGTRIDITTRIGTKVADPTAEFLGKRHFLSCAGVPLTVLLNLA